MPDRPHSLWDVMRHATEADADRAADEPATANEPVADNANAGANAAGASRSLWDVMQGNAATSKEPTSQKLATDSEPVEIVPSPTSKAPAARKRQPHKQQPRGKQPSQVVPVQQERPRTSTPGIPAITPPTLTQVPVAVEQSPAAQPVLETSAAEPRVETSDTWQRFSRPQAPRGLCRLAIGGCVLSVLALPLSALALMPPVWARFPATGVGFIGLMMSLMALGEIKRSRGRQTGTGLAWAGMILGTIAMFVGPLLLAPKPM